MRQQKIIRLALLLLVAAAPANSRATDIRQEEYAFRMEQTQKISRTTFLLGEFPASATLRPPVAASGAGRTVPALAVRVSERIVSQATPASVPALAARCAIQPVFFALGSAEVFEEAAESLAASIAGCTAGETPLTVIGHTCNLGPQGLNDRLALQRAEAVATILRRHGFTVADIRGKGKFGYRTTNPDEQHLNRRVEIIPPNLSRN